MPTISLTDYLSRENVIFDLASSDKPGLLATLAAVVAERIPDVEESAVLAQLAERESVQSTGIGHGLALPHGLVPGLEGPVLLVGRVDPPADFEALDGRPVDLLFLVLSPEDGMKLHLRLLARVARIIGREEVLQRLRDAEGADEAYQLLIEEDARHVY